MARRLLTAVLVLVALPVLLALSPVLLVAYLIWSPFAARAARRSAQAAVDRLFPGEVRVTRARGRGEAGGYNVDAVLLADPSGDLGWKGERRCDGGRCDAEILTAVANARDGAAERAALARAFDACGLTLSGEPEVLHRPTHRPAQPRSVSAVLSVAVPVSQLEGAGTGHLTASLDAAVLAWSGERAGLLPTTEYTALVRVSEPPGRAHGVADVAVEDGRLRTSAADTLRRVYPNPVPSTPRRQ